MNEFMTEGNKFYYNRQPVRILSGAIHYFRVMPEDWEDRMIKMKACGLNTVETYVAWNLHEPKPNQFSFEGILDIERFIRTAEKVGLHVIVRPGPYICSELDLGGLPSWLLAIPGMKLRCFNKPYLERVDLFFDILIQKLKPLLCTSGGPIIAMQVENEYGSYGDDEVYLTYMKEALINRGVDTLLFTSDGPSDLMLTGGTLPDVLKTVNFGSDPEAAFKKLEEHQEDKPLVCAEFWNGWFDQWGSDHTYRDSGDVAATLDKMLALGASVNFYMFHGGTNFGFNNGATYFDKYMPDVTSYDSDAPIDEIGKLTDKYYAIRDVISRYVNIEENILLEDVMTKSYGQVACVETVDLFKALTMISEPVKSVTLRSMEQLGQDKGFILYRTFVKGPVEKSPLYIQGLRDRAQIFVDLKPVGTIDRNEAVNSPIYIEIPAEGIQLDILVENQGRINYGPHLFDMKGILEGVRLENRFIYHWEIYTLPLDDLTKLQFGPQCESQLPVFCRGEFEVEEPETTFVSVDGWNKGLVYINGFNLGRYWYIGPQETLYVPKCLLKEGINEVVVFEQYGVSKPVINLVDRHVLGKKAVKKIDG